MVFGNEESTIPSGLKTGTFLIRPLLATDVELDYEAVMDSREILRQWEQSTWPADDFTLEDNLKDLQKHEREFNNREGFTYTVLNPAGTQCLGCIYIYPCTVRWLARAEATPVNGKDWSNYEAVVQFWIRQSRLAEGMDRQLLDVLRPWLDQEWDFDGYLFMTSELFKQQASMFENAGLKLHFELKDPKHAAKDLAYL
ncbi:MAG: N-acetyltransferase [Chloroflexota bacterium]